VNPSQALFALLAKKEPFYVVSHERSGTHFAINTLFANAYVQPRLRYVGDWLGPYDHPETRYRHLENLQRDWRAWRNDGGMVKTHADAALFRRWYPASLVVYVLRDPRDTLWSFYHYLNSDELHRTNPGLADQRCRDFGDFLRRPASDYLKYGFYEKPEFDNVVGRWAQHVVGWLAAPGVCVIRYEDLARDFRGVVRKVCRAVGLWPRLRKKAVGLHDATATLPRQGVTGEGRRQFSPEDEKFLGGQLRAFGLEQMFDGGKN
jgi:hypothetical protein